MQRRLSGVTIMQQKSQSHVAGAASEEKHKDSIGSYNVLPAIQAISSRDLVRTARTFASYTVAHGFYRLNHPVRGCQVVWALLIVGAFAALTVNMSSLVMKYRDEPTSTKISPRGSRYVPPDITVCNRMMFAISKVFNATRLVTNSSSDSTEYLYEIAPAFRPVYDSMQKIREVLELSIRQYLKLKYGSYETSTDLLRIEEEGIYNLPNLIIRDTYGERILSQFGANPVQMLLSCTYGTRACDIQDFQPLSLPAFPLCMTFNVQRFRQRRANVTTNNLNELRIGLFSDSQHNSPSITNSLLKLPGDWFNMHSPGGVVVFVHQPGTFPTDTNRIEAPVNQETVVDIRYLEYTAKSTRSNRCLSQSARQQLQYIVLENQTEKPVNFQSQLADCYASVIQEILITKCGFIDPTLPISVSISNQPRRDSLSNLLREFNASAKINATDPTSLINYVYDLFKRSNTSELPIIIGALLDNEICLRNARVAANSDPRMQRCTDYCQAKVYATSVMPIAWPQDPKASREFLRLMVQRWLQSNAYYSNGSLRGSSADHILNYDFIQQANWNLYQSYMQLKQSVGGKNRNYLAIRLRVADSQGLDMQTDESSSYELFDLFSDIGGLLGLYVGISVLTVCEVAELFFQLAVMNGMIAHRRRTEGPRQQQAETETPAVASRRISVMSGARGWQNGGLITGEETGIGVMLPVPIRRTRV